jgi:hypothetical protein
MQNRSVLITATVVLLSVCGACNRGKSLDRQAISGHVTLDARPLDSGSIQFSPVDKDGIMGGISIVDGVYQIPKAKGIPPGKYTVQIMSADKSHATARPAGAPGDVPPPLKERIPEQYNSKSQLSAEVKSGGENVFDFSLSSRPGR